MTLRSHYEQFGAYCVQYCQAVDVHHTIEDRHMFPALRSADSGLGDVLDRLADEHVVIHRVLVDLDKAAIGLVTRGEAFDEVDRLVDVLASGLLSHLAYEEDQLVGPLGHHAIVI
jgi:hemerythrin-like domain-containing protein